MKVIILAAGYATRLYPLTENKPKPLLVVAGKPIVEHILEKVRVLDDVDEIF
ncbi:NTP transferase domain-containing protein, partial [Candidatus Woesearchaeota archaeon]|nr:NTP transferase domain-containing protein [Candidatus Woesearchaeota archaeon]